MSGRRAERHYHRQVPVPVLSGGFIGNFPLIKPPFIPQYLDRTILHGRAAGIPGISKLDLYASVRYTIRKEFQLYFSLNKFPSYDSIY